MIELLFWIGVFIVSLAILIKSSDYFTDSAEEIGLYLGLPAFIVGVTIVALGTSFPELVSSIFAVLSGSSEIVVGNVIGSNITNIFLVLGISAIVAKKLKVGFELIHVDLPVLVASSFILTIMIWDRVFTFTEGIICLAGAVIYVLYTTATEEKYGGKEIKKEIKGEVKKTRKLSIKTVGIFIISSIFIFLGAKYTIDSVIILSEMLSIAKEVIAISAIALGTSLPELMVSVTAAKKGKAEIAVGNVLGSNIFNTFIVMSIPAFIAPLVIPESIFTLGLPVMLMATLLYFFITQDKEITKWEGMILVLFYIIFMGKLFGLI